MNLPAAILTDLRNGSAPNRSANGVSDRLLQEKQSYLDLIAEIRASGPVASSNVWVSEFQEGKHHYARLRSENPKIKGRRLGRSRSKLARDWQERCQRRDAIREVEIRLGMLQELILRQGAIAVNYPQAIVDERSEQKKESDPLRASQGDHNG